MKFSKGDWVKVVRFNHRINKDRVGIEGQIVHVDEDKEYNYWLRLPDAPLDADYETLCDMDAGPLETGDTDECEFIDCFAAVELDYIQVEIIEL